VKPVVGAPAQKHSEAPCAISNEAKSPGSEQRKTAGNQVTRRKKMARESKSKKHISTVPSVLWRCVNYRCAFCLKVLLVSPMTMMGWLWVVLGMRRHYCPHCFSTYMVPYGWLKYVLAPLRYVYISLSEEDD